MEEETFFLVWNPQRNAPTYKHGTLELATLEAKRLAAKTPNEKFFVLQAITCSEKNDVITRPLVLDPIPF